MFPAFTERLRVTREKEVNVNYRAISEWYQIQKIVIGNLDFLGCVGI